MQTNALMDYIKELYVDESDLQREIREQHQDQPINISPIKGKLLSLLVALQKPKKILEIGTLSGYSSLWLLKNAAIDAEIVTIEKCEDRYLKAKALLEDTPIKLLQGKALEVLPTLNDQKFDLIFLDADKINYLHYLDWIELHLNNGGLLICDDTLLFGAVYGATPHKEVRPTTLNNMKTFNERLSKKPWNSILLPIGNGLTIALFDCHSRPCAENPGKYCTRLDPRCETEDGKETNLPSDFCQSGF